MLTDQYGVERKRGVKVTAKTFDLNDWKDGNAILFDERNRKK